MSDLTESLKHHPEILHFWNALSEGEFLVRFCKDCGMAHWYPRVLCPHCRSTNTEWRAGQPGGTLYSYSVMRRVPEPYAIAYVKLDDGPTMMTNLIDSEFEALEIGKRVRLKISAGNGDQALPFFALC